MRPADFAFWRAEHPSLFLFGVGSCGRCGLLGKRRDGGSGWRGGALRHNRRVRGRRGHRQRICRCGRRRPCRRCARDGRQVRLLRQTCRAGCRRLGSLRFVFTTKRPPPRAGFGRVQVLCTAHANYSANSARVDCRMASLPPNGSGIRACRGYFAGSPGECGTISRPVHDADKTCSLINSSNEGGKVSQKRPSVPR